MGELLKEIDGEMYVQAKLYNEACRRVMHLEEMLKTTGEKPMNHDEKEVETMIEDQRKTAPRVRPEDLDAEIVAEQYHVFPDTTMTVCCLTLRNGFQVTGFSAAASPENFSHSIGRKVSRDNARNQIWPLLGFRLKDQMAEGQEFLAELVESGIRDEDVGGVPV